MNSNLENIPILFEHNPNRIHHPGSRMMTEPAMSPRVKQKKVQQYCLSAKRTSLETKSTTDQIYTQLQTNIKVFARFRPQNKMEQVTQIQNIIIQELTKNGIGSESCTFPDSQTIVLQPEQLIFTFDGAFSQNATQSVVYQTFGKDTILDVMNGYNGTIFAYGQTGSGKTYTMFGDLRDKSNQGIIPRSMYQQINQQFISASIFQLLTQSKNQITLTCSMLEIYKETLQDLFSLEKKELKIKENIQDGIFVENLTYLTLNSEEELLKIVELGEQTRRVAATRINQYSSRSHTIFQISIKQKLQNDTEKKGKLNLVDLAGSEKVGKTGASGEILEEAKKINLSLSCLGNVIHAITIKNEHIPYRDSKLTRLLQESLGGNYKTSLIVTCSTHSSSLEETISTLKFAQRAKNIRNHIKMNIKVSTESLIQEISDLKLELQKTKQELIDIKKISVMNCLCQNIQFIEIPNESSLKSKVYDVKSLSNQEKKCFNKKKSVQTTASSVVSDSLIQCNKSLSIYSDIKRSLDLTTPMKKLEKITTQQTSIDLSFFSMKKQDSSNEGKILNEQISSLKESEMQLIRQLDEIKGQLSKCKLECQKKGQKIVQHQCTIQNLEGIIAKQQKQISVNVKGLYESLQKNNSSLKMQTPEIADKLGLIESELYQLTLQNQIQSEYNKILLEENCFLNKQIELFSTFKQEDECIHVTLRDKQLSLLQKTNKN